MTDDLVTLATEALADRAENTSAGGYVWTNSEYDSRMRHREPLLAAGCLELTRQLAEARRISDAALDHELRLHNEQLRKFSEGRIDLTRQLAEARAALAERAVGKEDK